MGGFDQSLPRVGIEAFWLGGLRGEGVGIRVVDQDEESPAQGRHQLATSAGLFFKSGPGVGIFQMSHGEGRGHLEPSAGELCAQGRQVGGQVSVGPQLGPLVAGLGNLVEESLPGDLLGITGEPDSPGVRCTTKTDIHDVPFSI